MTFIYARVSSKEQALEGISLEAQVSKCLQYAAAHGLTLSKATNVGREGIFVDAGESAHRKVSLSQRGGGKAMLAQMQPGDHIIVTSPHRLFRNLLSSETQLDEWRKQNITVHFTDFNARLDSPNGRMLIQMMASIAEWSSAIKSQRIKEANAYHKARREGRDVEQDARPPLRPVTPARIPVKAPTGSLVGEVHAALLRDTFTPKPIGFSGTIRAYVRVSTDDQSVATQRDLIMRYLSSTPAYKDASVFWYDDGGYSAFKLDVDERPAGRQMMKDLQKGDMVIAVRADRVCRSIRGISQFSRQLKDKGASLYLMDCGLRTDGAQGDLLLSIMGFVGESESHDNAVSAGSAAAISEAANGVVPDRLPVWLRDRGHHEKEQTKKVTRLTRSVDSRLLMGEDRWFQMIREFYQMVESGEARGVKPLDPTQTKCMGWRTAARKVSEKWAIEMGWPLPSRKVNLSGSKKKWSEKRGRMIREMIVTHTTVGWALKEAIRMQEELGYTEERAALIKELTGKREEAQYYGPMTNNRPAAAMWRSINKWKSKCEEMGIDLLSPGRVPGEVRGPAGLERLAAIVAR